MTPSDAFERIVMRRLVAPSARVRSTGLLGSPMNRLFARSVRLMLVISIGCTVGSCKDIRGAEATSAVRVFKYTGAIQCQNSGLSLPAMEHQLIGAGVKVYASSCGSDGRLYEELCGGPSGSVGLFSVRADDGAIAIVLGFRSTTEIPDFQEATCK